MLISLLSGCFGSEDLMRAPRPAVQYQRLEAQIDTLLAEDYIYSVPLSGENRSAVMMTDLTGDGTEDAVVLLRNETEHILAVFLSASGDFTPLPPVHENAESVHSIIFGDINGDGQQEIIIGWQVASLRFLSVYTIDEDSLVEVFTRRFSGFFLYDIEDTGIQSLLVVYTDPEESLAELVAERDGEYIVASSAPLSRGAEVMRRTRTGPLLDGKPALYVTSQYQPVPGGVVTDVLTFHEGNLVNISVDLQTGVSIRLVREWEIFANDIDGDGVLDLPSPRELPRHPDAAASDPFFEIIWGAYYSTGFFEHTATAYHSFRDNWYLLLPEQWPERYTVRWDNISAAQSVTIFSLLPDDGEPIDFLRIYYNSQPSASRPPVRDRTILTEHDSFAVTAQLLPLRDGLEGHNITEEELKNLFHLIPADWRAP
jgi:hypothetical protein